jgi:hypothetical protein
LGADELELMESPDLAVGRIMARKELGYAKKTSCMRFVYLLC